MIENDLDWNAFPDDLQKFFGLEDSYDQKTLKRCYNKFIKKYKPEKHPEEFKKIRAAYEELNNYFRYFGEEIEMPVHHMSPTECYDEENEVFDLKSFQFSHADNPRETYDSIIDLEVKTPQHYYLLALLSDSFEKDNPIAFLEWLLRGIKAYPGEPCFNNLIYEYCHASHPSSLKPLILKKIASEIDCAHFYFYAEKMCLALSEELLIEDFIALIDELEKTFSDDSPDARVSFYIKLLRKLIFKATEQWIEEKVEFIESQYEHISPFEEGSLFFLESLLRYKKIRAKFLKTFPLSRDVDNLIVDFCEKEFIVPEKPFTELLVKILKEEKSFIKSKVRDKEIAEAVLEPIMYISREFEADFEDCIVTEPTSNGEVLRLMIKDLIKKKEDGWLVDTLYLTAYLLMAALAVGYVIVFPVWAASFVDSGKWLRFIILWNLLAWFPLRELSKNFLSIPGRFIFSILGFYNYRCYGRKEIYRHLSDRHIDFDQFVEELNTHCAEHEITENLITQVEQDYTLALYSIANRYIT